MYPVLFTIPVIDWPISSFGAMMALAFLVGYWIAIPRMREEGLDPDDAANLLMVIMIGGVFGAKLYYAVSFHLIHDEPFWASMFSRGGLVFYGGLIGGAVAAIAGCRYWKIPVVPFANVVCISLAVGQAIGRIGCFLVGDDYGTASDLPWAVAFPNGLPPVHYPVHPTMLYETLWLSIGAGYLWWRRKRSPFLMGEFLIWNGVGRTVIEHWRLNARVALGLSEAQFIGLGLVALGIALILWARSTAGSRRVDTEGDQAAPLSSRS
jgi:phosphatidylglycerol:prolipoprotein diacylglycerol transferase